MKKIFENHMKSVYKPLTIDPSLRMRIDLQELVDAMKIGIQSQVDGDNEVILMNMYKVMCDYFNNDIIDDIMMSSLEKSKYIELKRKVNLEYLLKNNDEDEKEEN
jgi:hypothetical protein